MAFIDSKLQYMREMQKEKSAAPEKVNEVKEPERFETVRGQPIDSEAGNSLFLDCLLTQLADMSEHSLAFNLQLANVLCSLAAYPQPILVAHMFNINNDESPHLIRVLTELKQRIDDAATSIEGLDVYVGRALRTLNGRAEKMERYSDGYISRLDFICPITYSFSSLYESCCALTFVLLLQGARNVNNANFEQLLLIIESACVFKIVQQSNNCLTMLKKVNADKMANMSYTRYPRYSPRDDAFAPITSLLRNHPFGNSGRRSHGIRYHSHKAIESEAAARDDAATKNIVHAAIVMANLCQYLAGIAMQQSVVVVTNAMR
ncbi:hypothetical protein DICVIV_08133 [Dictyocaulus viviparus]|uniref:FHF complex subunit HOOK-interacting protein C-terminal domain-containing protein n=1 Tax=Dictyocaulus viviparus TaxID=29172 RepID=A0A0D8XPU7_DICVI|nr:hypothetical protein DICVIV_08133 [Dictyocaulus viviparus]